MQGIATAGAGAGPGEEAVEKRVPLPICGKIDANPTGEIGSQDKAAAPAEKKTPGPVSQDPFLRIQATPKAASRSRCSDIIPF